MHIAIVTAGGAGMFCGSCMHDNTWARALIRAGAEVSLIPTYTPLRLDEASVSLKRVFFGGINVYLNAKLPWWRKVPRRLTRWLDRPWIIERATRSSVSNDAGELGELTLSMLQGDEGPHVRAGRELARFIAWDLKPDVVIFSNALLAGALPQLKRSWPGPVLCVLQGDDVFLDGLPVEYRRRTIDMISRRAQNFDAFITHTEFYRDYMARYLSLPAEKFRLLPLGIEMDEHAGQPKSGTEGEYAVGYFARIAPEKGLHHLADALVLLKNSLPQVRLKIGGYFDARHEDYREESLQKLSAAGIPVELAGSPNTAEEKSRFLSSLDVLSVPTEFLEPKGMYVLEALANGVPVIQPAHGSFPEIIERTQGGVLVPPRNPHALAAGLAELANPARRLECAWRGWSGVREHFSADRMARQTLALLQNFVEEGADSSNPSPNL